MFKQLFIILYFGVIFVYEILAAPSCPGNVPKPTAYVGTGGGGYYIGITYNTCNAEHTYICKNYGWRFGTCTPTDPKGSDYSCECIPTYSECYSTKSKNTIVDVRMGFDSPFNNKHCNKYVNVIVNKNDSKCYFTPNGSKVLLSGMKKRTVQTMMNNDGTPRIINGRCLVGAGWCPCQKS